MYTTRFIKLKQLLPNSIYSIFVPMVSSVLVFVLYVLMDIKSIAIPLLPLTVIGTAVSFYVGFKNNSSYDRLWEARRIWGGIVNTSRMFTSLMLELVAADSSNAVRQKAECMIFRHIAWINVLRLQLRRTKTWREKYYGRYIARLMQVDPEEFDAALARTLREHCIADDFDVIRAKSNVASYLLHLQNKDLKQLKEQGVIDAIEHLELTNLVTELYNHQGGCERIKNYPFPRQYAVFSRIFVDIFAFILPFGLVAEITRVSPDNGWLLIPVTLIVAWIFNAMEQIGDFSENPFENAVTDIPISSICRNIEIDLKEMMGRTDLPPRLQPEQGILM